MSCRILYVANNYPPDYIGGAELIAHRHAKQLQLLGCDCAVFAGDHSGSRPPLSLQQDVFEGLNIYRVALSIEQTSYQWANFHNPEIERLFAGVLHQERPDVVHFHNLPGLSVDLIDIAKENGCATVLTVHDHWGFCHRQTLTKPNGAICHDFSACSSCQAMYTELDHTQQPIEKRNNYVRERLKRLDLLISPSQYLAGQYIAAGYAPKHTAVLGYGVDLGSFHATSVLSARTHEVRFGVASYLGEHKGVKTVLNAISALPTGTPAKFYFAGKGPMERDIINFTSSDPNGHLVSFCGAIEPSQMADFYRSLDVFICASQWPENQPLTIMEAMASGLAVIATDCGGSPEMVQHGTSGLIVPSGSAGALTYTFQTYTSDASLAKRHGQAGQRIMSRQSLPRTALRLRSLYTQFAATSRTR